MKKVLFTLSALAVFMLAGCDDSSDSKPFIAEPPSSKALTPNNVAAVMDESAFPILWRVDGSASDVLVFVKKDGSVIGKVKEYIISSKDKTPIFNYDTDTTSGQSGKLILYTTVGNLQNKSGYDLIGSKIVKVGSSVEIKKDDIIYGAEDVISFSEILQGFAVYEEYDNNGWFNFNKRLFNGINAAVEVNNPVYAGGVIKVNNISSLQISASVPSEDDVTENDAEQNGMKYATYAGRVIEYPKFTDENKVVTERMPVKFNEQAPSANYTAQAYSKQANPATLTGEVKAISSTDITVNFTNLSEIKDDGGYAAIQLMGDTPSSAHKIKVKGYYLEK